VKNEVVPWGQSWSAAARGKSHRIQGAMARTWHHVLRGAAYSRFRQARGPEYRRLDGHSRSR
jgi:hypothetical protein